jgi:hypothetical protein
MHAFVISEDLRMTRRKMFLLSAEGFRCHVALFHRDCSALATLAIYFALFCPLTSFEMQHHGLPQGQTQRLITKIHTRQHTEKY